MMGNEILVKGIMDTGAIYCVKKCAEILFTNGRIIN